MFHSILSKCNKVKNESLIRDFVFCLNYHDDKHVLSYPSKVSIIVVALEEHSSIGISVIREIYYIRAVKYGNYQPHVTTEFLNAHSATTGLKF